MSPTPQKSQSTAESDADGSAQEPVEPITVTAPATEPDGAEVVVSNTPSAPVEDDKPEYEAAGPIYINGVRAYNEGDPVTAAAVEKNNLQKFVRKP